jgi:endonuclease I
MHAIFAADTSVNGSRGNVPFGNKGKLIEENAVGAVYRYENMKLFEPKLNKGALARASLYILVCYAGCANSKYLPKESVEWMIEAAQEEVPLW